MADVAPVGLSVEPHQTEAVQGPVTRGLQPDADVCFKQRLCIVTLSQLT